MKEAPVSRGFRAKERRRSIFLALVSSPILAVYGLLPVYIFLPIEPLTVFRGGIFLTTLFLLFWAVNLFLNYFFMKFENWKFYLASYVTIFLLISIAFPLSRRWLIESQNVPFEFIYPYFSAVVINSIILLLLTMRDLNIRRRDDLLEKERLKSLQIDTRHKLLLQHLQPHFLFNALSTLKSIIGEDPTAASDFTVRLSTFLRNSINSTEGGIQSVRAELDMAENYLYLQKFRFGNAFTYSQEVPESAMNGALPSFTVQTLIENAFKHNHILAQEPLSITITVEEDMICVRNNYLPNGIDSGSGSGLISLNERSVILTGKSIEVYQADSSYVVKVPIKHSQR